MPLNLRKLSLAPVHGCGNCNLWMQGGGRWTIFFLYFRSLRNISVFRFLAIAILVALAGIHVGCSTAAQKIRKQQEAQREAQRKEAEQMKANPTQCSNWARSNPYYDGQGWFFHRATIGDIRGCLTEGYKINARDERTQRTALHAAARYGTHATIAFLLENGANPVLRDATGNPACDDLMMNEGAVPPAEIIQALCGTTDLAQANAAAEAREQAREQARQAAHEAMISTIKANNEKANRDLQEGMRILSESIQRTLQR